MVNLFLGTLQGKQRSVSSVSGDTAAHLVALLALHGANITRPGTSLVGTRVGPSSGSSGGAPSVFEVAELPQRRNQG